MPLQLVRNDITNMRVDAIVNAANRSLLGGGGVDGAIHRAAGPRLLEACRRLNGCETGQAKLTPGFGLPCRWVIHTVGPIWRGGRAGERELLASCYRNSLALAEEQSCESVAFPLISSGAYGYPKAEALQVAVEEITRFLADSEMLVYIVVFTRDAVELSGRLFTDVVAYIDDVYVDTHYDLSREKLRRERAWPRAPLADDADAWYGEATAEYNRPSPARLEDMLDQVDESFSQMLLRKIDEKGISDAQCYKRANVDRRLFNKIKNNADYRPSKQTALAFAIALELTLEQTKELLLKAGYALSRSSKADIVVEYCITTGVYDLIAINQVLFKLDLQPLGY